MKLYGLIGYPLTHSFSKKYFTEKFEAEVISDCAYELFELESINQFPDLIASNQQLAGLNVTIPYKEAVLPYLHSLDLSAEKVGAVNVIKIDDGKLTGYNSDYYGFKVSLHKISKDLSGGTAVVLGTGGASKAVVAVLEDLNMKIHMISRTKSASTLTYDELKADDLIKNAQLIVNTTPLGMYPEIDSAPDIPYGKISKNCIAFDLVYNPEISRFLSLARQNGAEIKNGLEMLELQAEKSWEIWNA